MESLIHLESMCASCSWRLWFLISLLIRLCSDKGSKRSDAKMTCDGAVAGYLEGRALERVGVHDGLEAEFMELLRRFE